jgi:hypothetical protein
MNFQPVNPGDHRHGILDGISFKLCRLCSASIASNRGTTVRSSPAEKGKAIQPSPSGNLAKAVCLPIPLIPRPTGEVILFLETVCPVLVESHPMARQLACVGEAAESKVN